MRRVQRVLVCAQFPQRSFAGMTYIERMKRKKQIRKLKPQSYIQSDSGSEWIPEELSVKSPQDSFFQKKKEPLTATVAEASDILEAHDVNSFLTEDSRSRIERLLQKHPFYDHWIGKASGKARIAITERLSFGQEHKCFAVQNEEGVFVQFGIRFASQSPRINMEKIYFEACKSTIETSHLKAIVKNRMKDKSLSLNFSLLCLDFAKDVGIQVHSKSHLTKVIFRNSFGYWHFVSESVQEKFLKHYVTGLYKSKYISKKDDNPEELVVRPSSNNNMRIRELLHDRKFGL